MAANSALSKRSKSNSAPALFHIFSKDKKKEDVTRKLFTTLSEYIDDFETDPAKRTKVVALVNAYYRDLRRIISNDKAYELHRDDFKIVVDFLVEEFLNDPHKASILMGMVSYVDILNSTSSNGGFWRGNQTMSRYWLNARFQIAEQRVNIIKEMTTVFKVAFCDDKVKNKCKELLVKSSSENDYGKKLKEGLVNAIRITIFSIPNNVSDDECVDLSETARSIVLGDVVAESKEEVVAKAKEEVVAKAKEVVPAATVKPKESTTIFNILSGAAKVFAGWLFRDEDLYAKGAKQLEESRRSHRDTVSAHRLSEQESKRVDSISSATPLASKPSPTRPVALQKTSEPLVSATPKESQKQKSLAFSIYAFQHEYMRDMKQGQEAFDSPQPSWPLTDEHGSPLLSYR